MNKKAAEIAMPLLVLIMFILSLSALVAFVAFDNEFEGNSDKLSNMVSNLETAEQFSKQNIGALTTYAIKTSPKSPKEKLISLIQKNNLVLKNAKEIFLKIENNNFELEKTENNFKLEISPTEIIIQSDENTISRNVSICLEFDKAGNYLNDCEN